MASSGSARCPRAQETAVGGASPTSGIPQRPKSGEDEHLHFQERRGALLPPPSRHSEPPLAAAMATLFLREEGGAFSGGRGGLPVWFLTRCPSESGKGRSFSHRRP
uniref:Uncharacterized protein n=1 Tax=Sphaerodactylus townsendi TaxID=933632 RepID=A0ACB8F1E4_9SAUR